MGASVLRCFQQGALQSQPGRYGRSALALGVPATQSVRPGFQHALILKQSGLQEDPLEGLHPACRPPRWRGEPEGHAQCPAAVWTALRGVGSPGSKSARLERAWGDTPHAGEAPRGGRPCIPSRQACSPVGSRPRWELDKCACTEQPQKTGQVASRAALTARQEPSETPPHSGALCAEAPRSQREPLSSLRGGPPEGGVLQLGPQCPCLSLRTSVTH